LVEAPRYKPEGCGFDSPMVSLEFFSDKILLYYGPRVHAASNINEYQVYSMGVKTAGG
jgi:hypothetical protein